MPSRTKPLPMTAEEIEKQAEQYRQLAVSDHMDAGQFAQAHASLIETAARIRHNEALPDMVRNAVSHLMGQPAPLRAEEN